MTNIIKNSISRLDFTVWLMVIAFFCGCAIVFDGNLQMSFIGASGIIIEMLIIGVSIETIIHALKDTKGIGTITGFITNGPEALCLLVGLFVGDIIFAASTPLGSNFMNPVLLIAAALICSKFVLIFKTNPFFTWITISLTACMAVLFFVIKESYYWAWIAAVVIPTVIIFFKRPEEHLDEEDEENEEDSNKIWLIPAVILLTVAGYFLDSVVSFSAESSHAPKGVIGFLVLSTLTSWPEFKSCLSLLQRNKVLAAILNITVSNITNIWLAAIGVTTYLLM